MADYITEKALQATKNKIDNLNKQRGFFIRNFWTVLGFGIFASVWAPLQGSSGKSAVAVSNLSYYEMIAITAVCYTLTCFLAHNIWKWQDNKELKRLTERKIALENQLKSYSSK